MRQFLGAVLVVLMTAGAMAQQGGQTRPPAEIPAEIPDEQPQAPAGQKPPPAGQTPPPAGQPPAPAGQTPAAPAGQTPPAVPAAGAQAPGAPVATTPPATAAAAPIVCTPPVPPATAPARAFTSTTGIWLHQVAPTRVKEFQLFIDYLRDALAKTKTPTLQQQAKGWEIYRLAEPGPNADVLYAFVLDPAVPCVDYALGPILAQAYPDPAQLEEIWALYTGSVRTGGTLMNLLPVPVTPPAPLVRPPTTTTAPGQTPAAPAGSTTAPGSTSTTAPGPTTTTAPGPASTAAPGQTPPQTQKPAAPPAQTPTARP